MTQLRATILTGLSIDGRITIAPNTASRFFDKNLPPRLIDLSAGLRNSSDAIMVGINTIINDNPTLQAAQNKKLRRIVVDSKLRIPLDARILSRDSGTVLIACASNHDVEKRRALEESGVRVIETEGYQVNLSALMMALDDLGIASLLVEGGGKLNFSLLQENLVETMICVLFPFVVGNGSAPSLFEGGGFSDGNVKMLDLVSSEPLESGHVILEFRPRQSE